LRPTNYAATAYMSSILSWTFLLNLAWPYTVPHHALGQPRRGKAAVAGVRLLGKRHQLLCSTSTSSPHRHSI
jgi:hypothetical protein